MDRFFHAKFRWSGSEKVFLNYSCNIPYFRLNLSLRATFERVAENVLEKNRCFELLIDFHGKIFLVQRLQSSYYIRHLTHAVAKGSNERDWDKSGLIDTDQNPSIPLVACQSNSTKRSELLRGEYRGNVEFRPRRFTRRSPLRLITQMSDY